MIPTLPPGKGPKVAMSLARPSTDEIKAAITNDVRKPIRKKMDVIFELERSSIHVCQQGKHRLIEDQCEPVMRPRSCRHVARLASCH